MRVIATILNRRVGSRVVPTSGGLIVVMLGRHLVVVIIGSVLCAEGGRNHCT
jgi:hypothetical protein